MAQHLKMTKKELEEAKTIKWYKTWRWQNKNLKKLRLSNGTKHEDDKKRTWGSKGHQMAEYMKMTRKELEEVKTIKWHNTWRWQRKIVFDKCTTWRGFHTKSIQTDCTSEAESIFAVFLVQQGLFYSYVIPDSGMPSHCANSWFILRALADTLKGLYGEQQ